MPDVEGAAATEIDSAAAETAAVVLASEDKVLTKTELKIDSRGSCSDDEEDAEAGLANTGVPVKLIGITVRPSKILVAVELEAAGEEEGAEDSASADARVASVEGAAVPVTVRTPLSLGEADAVWSAGSVLGCGGIMIVSDA